MFASMRSLNHSTFAICCASQYCSRWVQNPVERYRCDVALGTALWWTGCRGRWCECSM